MDVHAPEKRLLVVLGATGNQGNAVLRHFAGLTSSPEYKLRGIGRNAESTASKQLTELGVEMVSGDLNDLPSLQHAFSGATHIYANTDSSQLIVNAMMHSDLLSEGQTPLSYAHDMELAYGKNIAEAAASTPTLRRIVWSSLASPKKWSDGRFSKVPMWDVKEEIGDVLALKPELKGKISTLMVGIYASMPLMMPQMYAPQKQPDGSYEMVLHLSGDTQNPLADLESDIGPWVAALFEADPGIIMVGATEVLSWKEWLFKWARHNGVEARFRQASDEEIAQKFAGLSDSILEVGAFLKDHGYTGGNPTMVYPDDLRRRGIEIPKRSIEGHILRTDWSAIL